MVMVLSRICRVNDTPFLTPRLLVHVWMSIHVQARMEIHRPRGTGIGFAIAKAPNVGISIGSQDSGTVQVGHYGE